MTPSATAFVLEAVLDLGAGVEGADVGAAVTVELCGHWEQEPPCRWPHNDEATREGQRGRLRTIYVADPAEDPEVRRRIEQAVSGADGWAVVGTTAREIASGERALAERLIAGPRRPPA